MKYERLTSTGSSVYEAAMALYRISFPAHEQREKASQEKIMFHRDYHFTVVSDSGQFVGAILYWETGEFIYVEHFCIQPDLRNRSYGQRVLEWLGSSGKSVILEIDPPVDPISLRRKGFYTRAGFRENPYEHVHPPYHEDTPGHGLVVMSCPEVLSPETYDKFYHYLKDVVMGQ